MAFLNRTTRYLFILCWLWLIIIFDYGIALDQTTLTPAVDEALLNQQDSYRYQIDAIEVESRKRIHQGWRACRWNNKVHDLKLGCVHQRQQNSNNDTHTIVQNKVLDVYQLPTTALTVLLDNDEIPGIERNRGRTSDRMYDYKYRNTIPDISNVGSSYYTLLYEYDIETFIPEASTVLVTVSIPATSKAEYFLVALPSTVT